MSGIYFNPIKRIFLNLSGGTVTGNTVFTDGISAVKLSGLTIYSGSTPLEEIITNISNNITTQSNFLPLTGGTGGPYLFTGGTIVNTMDIITKITPSIDNIVTLGSPIKRFRSLNIVNGITVNFTASTRVKTPVIELGSKIVTENNIILTGNCIDGGNW